MHLTLGPIAREHLDDARMRKRLAHQRRELVREVDGEEARHVCRLTAGGFGAAEFRGFLAAEPHRLVEERLHLRGRKRV